MDLSQIKPGINRVLIQLHPHNNKIKFLDGFLDLDTSFEIQDHVSVIGKIIGIGALKPVDVSVNSDVRLDWDPIQVLRDGDIVYMDFHAVLMALGQRGMSELIQGGVDTFFVQDGHMFVFIPYNSILLSVRDGKFVLPNGYVLVEQVMQRPETGLILPGYLENKPMTTKCKVVAAGVANTRYIDEKVCDVHEPLDPGDMIYVKDGSMIKLENDLHAVLPNTFHVVQRRWVLGVEKSCLRLVEQ